jgi:hypothetical protein
LHISTSLTLHLASVPNEICLRKPMHSLYLSFQKTLLPQSLQKQLKSPLRIVTLLSCTWDSSVLDRISYVSCFVVCEQGQETLEPQQHSEHRWFWEIQQ